MSVDYDEIIRMETRMHNLRASFLVLCSLFSFCFFLLVFLTWCGRPEGSREE